MNFAFLPTKIKKKIEALVADKIPISLARSSTSVDGKPGESYVVAYNDQLFVFSRNLGDREYVKLAGNFGKDIGSVNVRKEGVNSFLDAEINGKPYSLKFSSFDEKSLIPIMKQAQGGAGEAMTSSEKAVAVPELPRSTQANNDPENISKLTAMLAALMFVSSADDNVAKEEDQFIINIANNNQKLLKSALQYYKKHSFDELLIATSDMNQDQKLCFVANMMELGMCDGVLHRSEMKLVKSFCNYMNVTDDEYGTIKQVLLIKNKLSVL